MAKAKTAAEAAPIKPVSEYEPNDWAIHPAAKAFTPYSKDKLAELIDDIDERGIEHPIKCWIDYVEDDIEVGYVVDGQHRLKAATKLGLPTEDVPIVFLTDNQDPWLEAIRANSVVRRNMNTSQIAMVAARMIQGKVETFSSRLKLKKEVKQSVIEILDVSTSYADKAHRVLKFGDNALIAKVESGDMSVIDAADVISKAQRVAKKETRNMNIKDKEKLDAEVASRATDIISKAADKVRDKEETKLVKAVGVVGSERERARATDRGRRQIAKMKDDRWTLHKLHIRDLRDELPENSVDVVFVDPPYAVEHNRLVSGNL